MISKRKRIRRLVIQSIILVGCILANYYRYVQKPNSVSLWTMVIIGIILVIAVGIHLILLKRGV